MRSIRLPFAAISSVAISLLPRQLPTSQCSTRNSDPDAPGDAKGKPIYRLAEISEHTSKEKGIWVIYKDGVYDITKFIASHPGGSDKIVMAAGKSVEPFWRVYRQHYNAALPLKVLEPLRVGTLHPDDVAVQEKTRDTSDPYSKDPELSPVLKVHSEKPINAEPPASLLQHTWLTPNDLFFVRNHHPVPIIDPATFRLEVVIGDVTGNPLSLSLSDLQKIATKHEVAVTIQCGGNRRREMNDITVTAGTPWAVGAMSNAKWGGVKLRDVLKVLGIDEDAVDRAGIKHVHFTAVDGLTASVPVERVLSRRSEVLLAWEMNDEPIPAAHGYPLRVVVPGHVGVRNVKWCNKISLSKEEATGPWQRGMAYKGFGPSLKSLDGVDVERIPSLQEQPVQSTITGPDKVVAGEVNTLKGYAYSGGGRGIVRVDVSVDGGKTWKAAQLTDGSDQEMDRAWAWTFWEMDVAVPAEDTGKTLSVICKATDASYNVQPDSLEGIWNLRGINNNAWHRIALPVTAPEQDERDD